MRSALFRKDLAFFFDLSLYNIVSIRARIFIRYESFVFFIIGYHWDFVANLHYFTGYSIVNIPDFPDNSYMGMNCK